MMKVARQSKGFVVHCIALVGVSISNRFYTCIPFAYLDKLCLFGAEGFMHAIICFLDLLDYTISPLR